MFEAEGANGRIVVDDNFVTISREGVSRLHRLALRGQTGYGGEKRIPLTSITSVQFKTVGSTGEKISEIYSSTPGLRQINKAFGSGAGATGYIQFGVTGGSERGAGKGWSGTTAAIARDENTVMFTKVQEPAFEAIRDHIEQYLSKRTEVAVSSATPTPSADLATQIKSLKELHEAGVLSDDEFAQAKSKLIS